MLFSLAVGMIAGLDIFQGVLVLRTKEAAETFCRHNRLSAGGTVGVSFGPLGAGMGIDVLPSGLHDMSGGSSVLYAKSRGLFLGAHLDGKVAVTQQAANEAFYGKKGITAREILAGNVPLSGPEGMWPDGARELMEVLIAEATIFSRADVDIPLESLPPTAQR